MRRRRREEKGGLQAGPRSPLPAPRAAGRTHGAPAAYRRRTRSSQSSAHSNEEGTAEARRDGLPQRWALEAGEGNREATQSSSFRISRTIDTEELLFIFFF